MGLPGQIEPCRGIIVLGAERSGTSVVTDMICRWGAYPGEPEHVRTGDSHNPRGYWEYLPIWAFLAELGEFSAGVSWWDADFQQRVRDKLQIEAYRERALAMVAAMGKEGRPWVWKDPALSFFLPFWKEIWGRVAYVITVRHPTDTARSWQGFVTPPDSKVPAGTIAANLLRWQYMMLLILQETETAEQRIFVAYEDILREPQKQAERLCSFLDSACRSELTDSETIERMVQAVDPDLWHHQSREPTAGITTDAQRALYRLLTAKVVNPLHPVDLASYPMPGGWREIIKGQEA
jgi:hypothetical protein